jgi:hypothetical protein
MVLQGAIHAVAPFSFAIFSTNVPIPDPTFRCPELANLTDDLENYSSQMASESAIVRIAFTLQEEVDQR